MNRFRLLFPIICLLCLLFSTEGSAQLASTGYTPYSLFGIGDLTKQGTTTQQHMASVGTAGRNVRYINIINPAAVTAIEQKSFMMDFGLRQNNVIFQTNTAKSANNTFNLDHLVLAFPIAKKGAFHFGVNTESSVGYDFRNQEKKDEYLAEMGDIQYFTYGEGGIYKGFLGVGVNLWQRLNLGVDGFVKFGNISHYSTAYFSTASNYRSINVGNINSYYGFGAKLGVQYDQPVGTNRTITVGATYQLATNLGGTAVNYAFGTSAATDTIKYEVVDVQGVKIPSEMSLGISYRHSDIFSAEIDYTRQNWINSQFIATPGVDFATRCAQSFRAGFEYTPNRYDIRYYFKRITYHAGIYYERQYVSLNGHQITAQGLTFGVSLPVARYYNSVNVGLDIGQRGTLADGLIRERYIMFTLGFNFHDIWFIKQLYE